MSLAASATSSVSGVNDTPRDASPVHVVKDGDTLSGIAKQHGVSLDSLLSANRQIVNPNVIRPGQTVSLPAEAGVQADTPSVHTVRGGETLSGIAQQHGLNWRDLAADNGIANPGLIHAGQQIRLDGGAPAANTNQTPQVDARPAQSIPVEGGGQTGVNPNIGALSAQYETSGRGPGTVSSGAGDPGGVSYGSYQLAGNMNRPQEFLASEGARWAAEFSGATPGSQAFSNTWREIAAREPDAFQAAQHDYIQRTHYDVQATRVANAGLDVSTRSHALQDVVWSTSVQHGPNSAVVTRAMAAVERQGIDPSSGNAYDRALIDAVYDERGRRDANGELAYFSSARADVQAGVAQRFEDERRDALNMLDGR
ncbi:MAG: LysM peptidoglycan-binding domain-containing protein [Brevundimonas sp.]